MERVKYFGMSDDTDTCEHCGKGGLKRVVMLAPLGDDNEIVADPMYYGTACAARELGTTARHVRAEAIVAERKRLQLLQVAQRWVTLYPDLSTDSDAAVMRYADANWRSMGERSYMSIYLELHRLVDQAERVIAYGGAYPELLNMVARGADTFAPRSLV